MRCRHKLKNVFRLIQSHIYEESKKKGTKRQRNIVILLWKMPSIISVYRSIRMDGVNTNHIEVRANNQWSNEQNSSRHVKANQLKRKSVNQSVCFCLFYCKTFSGIVKSCTIFISYSVLNLNIFSYIGRVDWLFACGTKLHFKLVKRENKKTQQSKSNDFAWNARLNTFANTSK